LSLPSNGLAYLDANSIIYRVERVNPFYHLFDPIFEAAEIGSLRIVTSEVSLLECLVKPVRERDSALQALFRRVLAGTRETTLVPITRAILERAIHTRADCNLRTPDAIHAATSLELDCGAFYTNDRTLLRVADLRVQVLGDALT
jgi:predicted nucleic acid-binding protein